MKLNKMIISWSWREILFGQLWAVKFVINYYANLAKRCQRTLIINDGQCQERT